SGEDDRCSRRLTGTEHNLSAGGRVRAGAAERLTLAIDETRRVSALFQLPPDAEACFVLAHGAGAGMEHPSMVTLAAELAARSVATLRFQFPYMERGTRRPDPPSVCHATVRAAV